MKRPDKASLFEGKVFQLVSDYFEDVLEKSEDQDLLACLRKVQVSDVVPVIQAKDHELRRTKHAMIAPAVKKAYEKLREMERERMEAIQLDSDFEGVDPDTLMEVKDTNTMNKSVVDLWNNKESSNKTKQPTDSRATSDSESRKRERKETPRDPAKQVKAKKPKTSTSAEERAPASSKQLSELGGIDNVISQVLEIIVMPMARSEIYTHLGSEIPRGVLLHGPPGCGKTMLANAIANELSIPFISISAPSVVSGMSGESEKKLRDIFEEAKTLAPCLIFIDEIDAITPKRESVQREMERRIVAQLLTCMDSLSMEQTGGKPVMVIGATNRPDSIDPALRRGGRFDAEICMNVPDQDSREQILRAITSKLRLEGDFDYKRLAKATPGYVGADLQALVAAAGARAIKRIFSILPQTTATQDTAAIDDANSMDVDGGEEQKPEPESDLPAQEKRTNEVSRFLQLHSEPLTEEQLRPLAITFQDFLDAVRTVQPSSKREGFATVPDVNWTDVGAMTSIREELEYAIVEPIKNPELYQQIGISAPSGVLLWGPPGCGKTLLAKAVANESQANFISVRGPELLNKYVGESERAVRQVFVRARASVPCVIFFDELDALVPRRDDSNTEAASRVVNTLLTELDGVGDRNGVYVIGATNRRDMVDPAMMRPGRLDKQLFVELPTAEERADILKTVCRNTPLDPTVDLTKVAHDERCRNFSGADLASLNREASVIALKEALKKAKTVPKPLPSEDGESPVKVLISLEHFEQAFSKVRPSVSDSERLKYKLMNEAD